MGLTSFDLPRYILHV